MPRGVLAKRTTMAAIRATPTIQWVSCLRIFIFNYLLLPLSLLEMQRKFGQGAGRLSGPLYRKPGKDAIKISYFVVFLSSIRGRIAAYPRQILFTEEGELCIMDEKPPRTEREELAYAEGKDCFVGDHRGNRRL